MWLCHCVFVLCLGCSGPTSLKTQRVAFNPSFLLTFAASLMDPAGRRRCERPHNLPGRIAAAALLRATLHLAINLSLFVVQSQTEPNSLDSWNKITKRKKLKSTGEEEINKRNQSRFTRFSFCSRQYIVGSACLAHLHSYTRTPSFLFYFPWNFHKLRV